MNDLELCKKFAELEGVEFSSVESTNQRGIVETLINYNPITDLALTMAAVIKYEVEVCYRYKTVAVWIESTWIQVTYKDKVGLPRAVIECILKSESML